MPGDVSANLPLYRWHQTAAGALFWLPTVVLYLAERTSFATALSVQAVYYVAVVALELPSGWVSDRVRRVAALRIVALSWLAAHVIFVLSTGVLTLMLAQLLLAAGYAFLSGTDVTFHYDTLEALGRESEFEDREAAARQRLLLVTAGSALAGGLLGTVDLRLPFVVSGLVAVLQAGITWRMTEPAAGAPEAHVTGTVVSQLRSAPLVWLVAFIGSQVVAVHLVADLGGPYLADALDQPLSDPGAAAAATGISSAAGALVGAACIRLVPSVRQSLGAPATLLLAACAPVVVLGVMALVSSVWALPLLTLRSLPSAAIAVIVPAIVGRLVLREFRAQFLSLASLAGRLTFAAVLVAFGTSDLEIGDTLRWAATTALISLVVVAAFYRVVIDRSDFADVRDEQHLQHAHAHLHVHWGAHDHAHGAGFRIHRHPHAHHHDDRS